jgi:hypothetical protein
MSPIAALATAVVVLSILVLISVRNFHFDLQCLLYCLLLLTVELLRENFLKETPTSSNETLSWVDLPVSYSWNVFLTLLFYVILGGLGVYLAKNFIFHLFRHDSADREPAASTQSTGLPERMESTMTRTSSNCPMSTITAPISITDSVFSDAADCKKVMGAAMLPKLGRKNKLNIYEARALPNQRLVAAFGIKNSFTAHNKEESQFFLRKVEEKLYLFDEAWQGIALAVKKAVDDHLNTADQSTSLFNFTLTVSMKSALYVLFDLNSGDHSLNACIGTLAHEINAQWIRSKGKFDPAVEPHWRFEGQENLR